MSARGTKLRKFHNMANSVIIFDEIQSLPLNIINPFNEVVSFLSTILDSTILLCSATQPLLERTARKNLRLSDEPDLIDNTDGYEEKLKRTRILLHRKARVARNLRTSYMSRHFGTAIVCLSSTRRVKRAKCISVCKSSMLTGSLS